MHRKNIENSSKIIIFDDFEWFSVGDYMKNSKGCQNFSGLSSQYTEQTICFSSIN